MSVYKTRKLEALLSENPYPGRGIVLGGSRDGTKLVAVYFIMGRSANSRNRVFMKTGDGIRTQARNPEKLEDPSLIIYHPVRQVGGELVVANGDQTDTIRDALAAGGSFESALLTRSFEPDIPNLTPRISGILFRTGAYTLSILKSADARGSACIRQFFHYPPLAGTGHFIHTYNGDGVPLPSFTGEPRRVEIPDDMNVFAKGIWDSLNPENKISLYLRHRDLATGETGELLFNQYGEEGAP